MIRVLAARTQPIIANATLGMLKEHLLPVAYKLRENAKKMEKEEEEFHAEMRRTSHRKDQGEMEYEIQEVYILSNSVSIRALSLSTGSF
jgi:hypothetical protein